MKDFDVVVVGELNVDMILQGMNSFPELGKEKIAPNMVLTMGSASGIMASNMANLELDVGFIGRLGDDHFGELIIQTLKVKKIDCSGIIISDNDKTGITVSLTFPDNYAMVTYLGAMASFSLEDVDFDYLSKAKHMHFSSFYLQPGMRPGCRDLFRRAKDMGLTTSFDPGWDPEEKWEKEIFQILDNVDIFFPNEKEALNISGIGNVVDALEKLCRYSSIVVIKQGCKGAIAKSDDEFFRARTFEVIPKDTTGAGDSFNAGFLSKWLNGEDLKECLIAGSACGALATTKLGGITAAPTLHELSEFLHHHNENIFCN